MSGKDGAQEPHEDPQDAQFGRAAERKEERLDESLERGGDVPPDEAARERPRAGSKGTPDEEAADAAGEADRQAEDVRPAPGAPMQRGNR